ncbi:hypothetical protein FH972_022799 [Carpinus fangiana]|uniref:Uncharacterized protein n=1 Tax=Carpinus fangiana TaxID=176857 RepID=A0A5N6KTP2_9ROSI|nr:hypothetical protein FH972_022799 [Carpinus fangiana]
MGGEGKEKVPKRTFKPSLQSNFSTAGSAALGAQVRMSVMQRLWVSGRLGE